MPFPWELNLDRPYRYEKCANTERLRTEIIDSTIVTGAEERDSLPVNDESPHD